MKVSLVDVDSKIPNLALMKVSAYHKARGDEVNFYGPLFDKPDVVYASKLFNFTPEYGYYPDCDIIRGGTGYGIKTRLPPEIESMFPDYSIYDCSVIEKRRKVGEYALGFTSRGCIRNCPFCVVPEKEGKLQVVGDIYSFWSGQKYLMLLDNNFTATPFEHFITICQQFRKHKIKVNFQGLDIRLLTDDHARILAKVSLWKQMHFAWDFMEHEQAVRRGIEILRRYMPISRVMFYVLIGYNTTPEEDLYRVETLRGLKVAPFVMPYDKSNAYQRRFARWVDNKAVFNAVPWERYAG